MQHDPIQHDRSAAVEQAFDRLNPEFGIGADTRDPVGRQAMRDREAGLALGARVATALDGGSARDRAAWPTAAAAWGAVPQAEHDWGWAR